MKRKSYLPTSDAGKVIWLNNFKEKLLLYAAALGITPVQLAQLATDVDTFSNILLFQNNLKDTMEAYTGFKNLLRNGTASLPAVPPIAAVPMLPMGAQSNILAGQPCWCKTLKAILTTTQILWAMTCALLAMS